MRYAIECVPASDGVAVAPCGAIDGVPLTPVLVAIDAAGLDYSGAGPLFSWALSFVLVVFVVGFSVGAIMRVIRSA